jgi:hypothetical protein
MQNNNNTTEVAVISQVDLITKAEIDMQISTAKAFPREISTVLKKAREMALLTEDIAQSCVYALPRQGKVIDGPSVRLAEIVASNFGNMRTGARVISNDGKNIVAQGICHDLESNNCVTVEVSRRITDKYGKTYNQDMQTLTGNAACAIAFRNAVFKVIPAALINTIFDDCKDKARGKADELSQNTAKAIAFFNTLGVAEDKIFTSIGIKSKDEMTLEKVGVLRGMAAAIKNGETTIKDLFEPSAPANTQKADINKEEERASMMIANCKTIDELNEVKKNLPAEYESMIQKRGAEIIDEEEN